jgi:hypothetical protein
MSIFEFDKVYVRDRKERDYVVTDLLFLHTRSNSLLFFDGLFYLLNKGNTLNLDSFHELTFSAIKPGESLHVTELYNGHKFFDCYMVLEEGIIKFFEGFNTAYGCTTTSLILVTPDSDQAGYSQLQEAIKTCEKLAATDWRFL